MADSCLLGTAHPPGYPLFLMMSWCFSHVCKILNLNRVFVDSDTWNFKFEDPTFAWKVNIMCCLLGALGAGFVGMSSIELLSNLGINRWQLTAASITCFLFAFSTIVWENTISTEVFALNNFLLSLLLYLTIRHHSVIKNVEAENDSEKPYRSRRGEEVVILFIGALVSGLVLSNQHAGALQVTFP